MSERKSIFARPHLKETGVVILTAVAARLIWALFYWGSSPTAGILQNDAWSHFQLARDAYLADTWIIGDGPYYQPPFYAYCLLFLHHLGIHEPASVIAIQSVVGILWGVLTLWLARQLLPVGWAVASALFLVCAGPPILYEHSLLPTATAAMLHLLGIAGLALWWKEGRCKWLVAGGAFSGLACITRPHFLAAAVLQGAWLIYAALKQKPRSWRVVAQPLIVYSIFAALGPLATLTYNTMVAGDPVLISANGGVTFCMGTGPQAVGYLAPVPGLAVEIENQRTDSIRLASENAGKPLSPSEASAWWYRQGIAWMIEHPWKSMVLLARKLLLIPNLRSAGVDTSYSFEASCVPMLLAFKIPLAVVLVVGFSAVFSLYRVDRPLVLLLFTSIMTYLAVSVLFYVSERFRTAALPALAVLGAAWVRSIWRGEMRVRRYLPALTVTVILVFAPAEWWLGMPRGTLDRTFHGLAWYNLGAVAERNQHVGKAEVYYRNALEINPALGIAHKNLGVLLAKEDRTGEAETHMRRACDLLPGDAEARRNLDILLQGSVPSDLE